MHYGDRIIEIRDRYKLNQKELASKLGMSPQSLIKYEKASTGFTLKFRDKLLKAFSVKDVDYIQYGSESSGDNRKIGNVAADSHVNQGRDQNVNSNNSGEVLSSDEQMLINYFRKSDEMTKAQILMCALEKYTQMSKK